MRPDPDKVVDASRDKSVKWDDEIAGGALVPIPPRRDFGGEHVQGIPLTDAERAARQVPGAELAKRIEEARAAGSTAFRPPSAPNGAKFDKAWYQGGWPEFDENGRVKEPKL